MTDSGKARLEAEEYEVIFRKTIRTKSGKLLVAAHYGLQAFPIRVRKQPSQQMELF